MINVKLRSRRPSPKSQAWEMVSRACCITSRLCAVVDPVKCLPVCAHVCCVCVCFVFEWSCQGRTEIAVQLKWATDEEQGGHSGHGGPGKSVECKNPHLDPVKTLSDIPVCPPAFVFAYICDPVRTAAAKAGYFMYITERT